MTKRKQKEGIKKRKKIVGQAIFSKLVNDLNPGVTME